MRKTITLTTALVLFTACAAIHAGEMGQVEAYKFKFGGANGDVELELNSETMGFSLRDLLPGDVRTTVTEDGTDITVSRLAETYTLDIGSEVFEIPARHGPPHMAAGQMNRHGEEIHRIAVAHGVSDGLTIMTRDPLDETRRATILSALAAAGITDEVAFLSPGFGSPHEGMIEKHIEDDGEGRRMVIKQIISD